MSKQIISGTTWLSTMVRGPGTVRGAPAPGVEILLVGGLFVDVVREVCRVEVSAGILRERVPKA